MKSIDEIPRYLQVAHWIYEQHRMVSARDATDVWGGSAWAMEQIFSKIRLQSDIILSEEALVPSKGRKLYLIRIIYIYPYTLDLEFHPHRQLENNNQCHNVPLTWKDLLGSKWGKIRAVVKEEL